MRYIHQSVVPIRSYIASRSLSVVKCNSDGSSSPIPITSDAIEEMLEQSQSLWGISLPHFICVSKSIATNCISIDEAVAKMERPESYDDFLIVAYQDGGVISISGRLLPFQEIAEPAEW